MHISSYVEQIINRQSNAITNTNKLAVKIACNTDIDKDFKNEILKDLGELSKELSKITHED